MDRPANGTAAASTSSPCTVAAVSASPPGRRPVSASAGPQAGVGLRRQHEPGGRHSKPASDRHLKTGHLHGAFRPTGLLALNQANDAPP